MHPDAQRSWTKSIPNFFKWKLRKRYITSLYLAMTTFSTVGYGDLHAESQGEMIFSIMYMIWNIGFLAYIMQHFDKIIQRITDKHVSKVIF
jgi:potassium channel